MAARRVLCRMRSGQTLAEFAIVVLVFLLLVVGVVDLSRAVYAYNQIKSAAREGARYATMHPYDEEGVEEAAKALIVGLDVDDVSVELTPCECGSVQVDVRYTWHPVTAILIRQIDGGGQGVVLTGSSKMTTEVSVDE